MPIDCYHLAYRIYSAHDEQERFAIRISGSPKLALAGDHDPARLGNAIANPQRLTAIEKSAWVQLHNWSADANLRAQYPQIADFSRRRINELLVQLED